MTSPTSRQSNSPTPSSWRSRVPQGDIFGWSVALVLAGMLGWVAWGLLTTNIGPLPLPQVSLPNRDTPGDPVAVAASPTPATPIPDGLPLPTSTSPPVTATSTPTRPAQADGTPTRDPAPNGWDAGTVLYITTETGYHADIYNPPADPTQLQPGDTVTVERARQTRGFYEWVEYQGDRWWFVDGWGWLPEAVLSETPPG